MNDEERIAWLLEHCVVARIREEIDRVFQRFYYFLVASSFLLSGLAILIAQLSTDQLARAFQTSVMWVLLATGFLLSLAFWVINSWNSRIAFNYDDRLRPGGKAWPLTKLGTNHLERGFRALGHEYDECLKLRWYAFGGLFVDLVSAEKPAWFARYIPFVLSMVWLALGWVSLVVVTDSYSSPWWSGPVLVLFVSGVVALVTILRPTAPARSWLLPGETSIFAATGATAQSGDGQEVVESTSQTPQAQATHDTPTP